ncbi:hypothetical protein AMTR_s00162p00044560 [Amborella trichopoda]|uniref:Uncharacterized protein n=1 Tax=Amborella trichopoda TaxID=13333 RepID=W1PNG8_AMBTC|nr:hypothetical protein AMTR_s00162p00044560 [Amborella trichopoda]
MISTTSFRLPRFGLIVSSSRPPHFGSSAIPSCISRPRPATSSACGVSSTPSWDKGKLPAFPSNPPPISPPPLYCNYVHLFNLLLPHKAPSSACLPLSLLTFPPPLSLDQSCFLPLSPIPASDLPIRLDNALVSAFHPCRD